MPIREIILKHLADTVAAHSPLPFPEEIDEAMPIEEFWLDSVAFAAMLTSIEGEIGFSPPQILRGIAFPETIGELIIAYEREGALR